MFKKILVPLDGSDLAERALKPAIALASESDGEIILMRVPVIAQMLVSSSLYDGQGVLYPEQSLQYSRQSTIAYLHDITEIHTHPNVNMRTAIVEGDVAMAIVDTAQNEQVDLIVMSTHGRTGFGRWILGSVAEKVMQTAACPVLAIRSDQPIENVLIPLDGSDLSEQALPSGIEVAKRLGAQVTLMHAVPRLESQEFESLEYLEQNMGRHMQEQLAEAAESYLHAKAQTYQQVMPHMDTYVSSALPADGILEAATAKQIDLIAMSTHGRTGLSRWVYGSVTHKVIRSAKCSMLVIRPPEH